MSELSRQLVLKVKDRSYTIEFPKVAQFLNIEVKKSELSGSMYGSMLEASTIDSSLAVAVINAVATFQVLCPKMLEDLKVNILDLDLEDAMELIQVYSKQYVPWYRQWRDKMRSLAGLE